MNNDESREPLHPETIDEYIRHMPHGDAVESRLAHDLQVEFQERREEEAAFERMHQRLHLHMSGTEEKSGSLSGRKRDLQGEREHPMDIYINKPQKHILNRRAALAIASTVAVLIAASFLMVLQLMHISPKTPPVPVVAGKASPIYVSVKNELVKYDPQQRKVLWRYAIISNNEIYTIMNLFVYNQTVYFTADRTGAANEVHEEAGLYALNSETGKVRWIYRRSDVAQPTVRLLDGVIYMTYTSRSNVSGGKVLLSINADGTVKKQYGAVKGAMVAVTHDFIICTDMNAQGYPVGLRAMRIRDGSVAWRKDMGNGQFFVMKDPTVQGNTLYVAVSNPFVPLEAKEKAYIYALNLATGEKQWQSPSIPTNEFTGLTSSNRGVLYFGTSNMVYALDTQTHKLIWQKQTDDRQVSLPPLVEKNTVYFFQDVYGEDPLRYVVALDPATGGQKWISKPLQRPGTSLAIRLTARNGMLLVCLYDGVVGISMRDGSQAMSVSYETLLGHKVTVYDNVEYAYIAQ